MGSPFDRAEPVQEREFDGLFQPLVRFGTLVFAVSGGPDSMALLHLASLWRERLPPLQVVTVDHQLRAESEHEAAWVAARVAELGLPHTTLRWDGPRPASGIMAAARDARYRLLAEFARRFVEAGKSAAVVTAHTEDDQAETFLMRLARGSGLDGLAAMAPTRKLGREGVMLVRPLLSIPKARLVATLEAAGIAWLSDPSNERCEFERVRLRQAASLLVSLGLTSDKVALSARRLMRAKDVIDQAVVDFCQREVGVGSGVFALVSRDAYSRAAAEIQVRVLARLVRAFGGEAQDARLSQVEELARVLGGGKKVAVTLGGVIASAGDRAIRVYREPGRVVAAPLILRRGESAVWDRRYLVSYGGEPNARDDEAAPAVTVRALGAGAYATLAASGARTVPARAAFGLPSFWDGSKLIAVPQLDVKSVEQWPAAGICRSEFIGWEREAG